MGIDEEGSIAFLGPAGALYVERQLCADSGLCKVGVLVWVPNLHGPFETSAQTERNYRSTAFLLVRLHVRSKLIAEQKMIL